MEENKSQVLRYILVIGSILALSIITVALPSMRQVTDSSQGSFGMNMKFNSSFGAADNVTVLIFDSSTGGTAVVNETYLAGNISGGVGSFTPNTTSLIAGNRYCTEIRVNGNLIALSDGNTRNCYTAGMEARGGMNISRTTIYGDVDGIGIGTTNPAYKLHIVVNSSATDYPWSAPPLAIGNDNNNTGTFSTIAFRHNNSINGAFGLVKVDGNEEDFIWYLLKTGTVAERMRLTAGGNLGIGTTNPVAKLHVQNPDTSNNFVPLLANQTDPDNWAIEGRSTAYGIYHKTTENVADTIPLMRLDSSSVTGVFTVQEGGNIGIGTTTPNAELHIDAAATDQHTDIILNNKYTTNPNSYVRLFLNGTNRMYGIENDGERGVFKIRDHTGGKDVIAINNATGYVGIGNGVYNPQTILHVESPNAVLMLNGTGGVSGIKIHNQVAGGAKVHLLASDTGFGGTNLFYIADSSDTRQFSVNVDNGNAIVGDGSTQSNITMTSPDGTEFCCGVSNAGTYSCSSGACS